MKQAEQIPRNALVWIIASLFTLVLPHVGRLPPWVLALYLGAALWRVMVYRGRWSFPRWPVKLALILGGVAGILASFRSLIGLEPTVALLLVAFALKLVELVRRKDAYVLLFLGYFVVMTEFLFSQDLLIVLLCLFNVVLVTAALVALHRPDREAFSARPLKLAGSMILQAVPLMLVLFFLFPRIGPLWTVPLKSHTAVTGMTDTMRPGDVSRLSLSGGVAFRVAFDGGIPPRSELYWRGLVMSKYSGGTWSTLSYYDVPPRERRVREPATPGEPLRYDVIMAATQQRWVYGLRYARSPDLGIMEAADFRMFRPIIIEDDLHYRVESWTGAHLEENLSEWRRKLELALPEGENPRTVALGREFASEAQGGREVVNRALRWFGRESFAYTLQPPPLPASDPLDYFLFRSRRGFCEHFASAFVVLMRAAGVPARVVAGYQGGEVNPVNRTIIVHQFDAHAWAEVWLPGEGWVRVDPTSVVAPVRLEQGLEQAVEEEGTFLADTPFSPLRYRGIHWLNLLRLRYDALTYRWQSWVVGFDAQAQFDLLQDWFGQVSPRKFIAVFAAGLLLALLPGALALVLHPARVRLRRHDKLYLAFCKRLARMGVRREPGEPPGRFAARAALALPRLAAPIADVTRRYQRLAYAPSEATPRELAELAREVRRVS